MATGASGYVDFTGTQGMSVRVGYQETYSSVSGNGSVSISYIQVKSSSWYGVTYYLDGSIKDTVTGATAVSMSSTAGSHPVTVSRSGIWYTAGGTTGSAWSVTNDEGRKDITIAVSIKGYSKSGDYGSGWTVSGSKAISWVTVKQGDTLSGIAQKHGNGMTYQQIAAINNISDPNRIQVGQTIFLTTGANPTSGSSSKSTSSNKPTITQFGELSNVENTLFATWSWSKSNTESYKVLWTYNTGNGVYLVGNNSTITVDKDAPSVSRQSTYSIPSGARTIQFKVKPISEKKTSNGEETSYWTADWSTVKTYTVGTPLKAPNTPSIETDKYLVRAYVDNIGIDDLTGIEFEIVKNNEPAVYKTAKASIVNDRAAYSCYVEAGGKYKARCRSMKGSERSEWTAYSNEVTTIPAAPSGITTIRANDETSVYLEWAAEATATAYDIEYATKLEYFDGSDQTTTKTGIEYTHYIVSGLETGQEYFFRVRAINEDVSGDNWSAWTEIKSVVVGKDPAPPTTWSSTTTAIVGEELVLYWVHNSEDGSKQTYAELDLYVDGVQSTYTLADTAMDNSLFTYTPLTDDEKEDGKANCVYFKTTTYVEGTKIEWRVRTAGITKVYSDWSIKRTVDTYAPPTLTLSITDADANVLSTVTEFPFYIKGVAGPKSQAPIGYHLVIKSQSTYDTTDNIGNDYTVNAGDEVYSNYFDTFEALLVEFSASNIDLQNNITYTASCTVSMDSGLTAETSLDFSVAWIDMEYAPNAEIGFDEDTYTAYIRPYCEEGYLTAYEVTKDNDVYTVTENALDGTWGEEIVGAKTTTGEQVYYGVDSEGNELYFCEVEIKNPITNVTLSVYRREFDGSFVEIVSGLDGDSGTTVTDPHPSLDYARYRIVAISKDTGSVSYFDAPGYPVNGKAAIIQWDETWTNFEVNEENSMEQPPWSGSLLSLSYNIDVSDNSNPDVARIEYIGREHPIAYYGTQLGHTANWSMEIDKSDRETLYALRRLQRWMGDVYVREPSGSGYWANITVSFSQKHCQMTIPVTLSVVRVEGGV